jgi:hypothetical protein
MLQYFQSAYLNRYLVLFTFALICWLPELYAQTGPEVGLNAILTIPILHGTAYYIALALAFTVTITAALLTNQIASDSGFSNRISTISLMLFVLFSSSLVSFTNIQVFILINLLLVFFVRLVFLIPVSQTLPFVSYNATLLVGLASLFFTPAAYLVVLLWIALLIHRAADLRSFLTSILGLLTPYFFTFLYFFWYGRIDELFTTFTDIININVAFLLSFDIFTYIILIIFVFLTLISAFQATAKLTEKNINHRRNLMILLYFLIFMALIVGMFGKVASSFLLLAVPISLVVSQSLKETRKSRIYNIVLFTLAVLILANHYINLLV